MTEPDVVTADHLRDLLAAPDGAVLGVAEGQAQVVDDADEAAGTLELMSRKDLVSRVGAGPSDEALAAEASALTVAAQQLGG